MIVWACDRCHVVVDTGTRRNQRPDGWATIRLQPSSDSEARNWLLCGPCLRAFFEAMAPLPAETGRTTR